MSHIMSYTEFCMCKNKDADLIKALVFKEYIIILKCIGFRFFSYRDAENVYKKCIPLQTLN